VECRGGDGRASVPGSVGSGSCIFDARTSCTSSNACPTFCSGWREGGGPAAGGSIGELEVRGGRVVRKELEAADVIMRWGNRKLGCWRTSNLVCRCSRKVPSTHKVVIIRIRSRISIRVNANTSIDNHSPTTINLNNQPIPPPQSPSHPDSYQSSASPILHPAPIPDQVQSPVRVSSHRHPNPAPPWKNARATPSCISTVPLDADSPFHHTHTHTRTRMLIPMPMPLHIPIRGEVPSLG